MIYNKSNQNNNLDCIKEKYIEETENLKIETSNHKIENYAQQQK